MVTRTGFVFEELYMWHDTGTAAGLFPAGLTIEPGQHGENPETKRRLRNLLAVGGILDQLVPLRAQPVDATYLQRFHTPEYVSRIREQSQAGGGDAGELTPFGPGSYEIACLSAGGTKRAVEAVLSGEVANAYCLVRPPGHHAERDRGRGFCLFGNIALAVLHARRELGVDRVAVVDWDVHHGNGTEQAFYEDPSVLTISLHQDNLYPAGTGRVEDNGKGAGLGYNLNLPLPPGTGVGGYVVAFERLVLPALERFQPDLIMVASGFDGSGVDPFGRMMMHSGGYRTLTRMLLDAAARHCGGRLVLSHEGGYSPYLTPYCGLAVIEALSGLASGISDPFLPMIETWGGQALQPHQAEAIARATALMDQIRPAEVPA